MSETQQTQETPAQPQATTPATTTPQTTTPQSSPDTSTTKTQEPNAQAEQKPSVLNEKDKDAAAPAEYTAFKVPDGYELDGEVSKEIGSMFKGMNLSQENAQKLVDFYVSKTQSATDEPYKAWEATQEKWRNEIAADPDIGGKLPQVKVAVSRMLDSLGDPKLAGDFRMAMDFTGAGNNPAFIKAMFKLASMLGEGQHVSGGQPSVHGQRAPGAKPESAAKAMYPNLP